MIKERLPVDSRLHTAARLCSRHTEIRLLGSNLNVDSNMAPTYYVHRISLSMRGCLLSVHTFAFCTFPIFSARHFLTKDKHNGFTFYTCKNVSIFTAKSRKITSKNTESTALSQRRISGLGSKSKVVELESFATRRDNLKADRAH